MNPEIPEDDSREITITKETITDEEKLLISETIEKKTIGEIKKEELSKFKLQNPSNKYNLTSYLIPISRIKILFSKILTKNVSLFVSMKQIIILHVVFLQED